VGRIGEAQIDHSTKGLPQSLCITGPSGCYMATQPQQFDPISEGLP
jgi:hypothetical protein